MVSIIVWNTTGKHESTSCGKLLVVFLQWNVYRTEGVGLSHRFSNHDSRSNLGSENFHGWDLRWIERGWLNIFSKIPGVKIASGWLDHIFLYLAKWGKEEISSVCLNYIIALCIWKVKYLSTYLVILWILNFACCQNCGAAFWMSLG